MSIHNALSRNLFAAVAIGALASSNAVAQTTTDSTRAQRDSARKLGAVVVTATRTERSLRDVPVSTTVVPRADVRATPAQTVDDVVRTIPGVYVPFESAVVEHPTANFVSMRGLGGIRTLVLQDGVPLNDPFFGYVQWNKIPMELIDHIEVVRGGSSNLFGTYALGGVINMITRTPRTDAAEVEASYGTNDTRRGNVFVSRSLTPALRVTFDGNYSNTSGYLRPYPDQIGPLDRNGWGRAATIYGRADYTPSRDLSAYVRSSGYSLTQNQGSPLGRDGQHAWDVAAGVNRRFAGGRALQASAFFERDRVYTNNTDPLTARGVDEFLSNLHTTPARDIGGSIQWSQLVAHASATLLTGLDFRSIEGEDRSQNFSAPNTPSYFEAGGGGQRSAGLFAQLDWFATPSLELLAGARLDAWQNFDGHDVKTPGPALDFADRSKARVNPKLAVRYVIAEPWTLRGAVYQAFNAPNLDQLYRPYSAQNYANVANSQLDPETLTGGEMGIEYRHGDALQLQLTAFQSNLKNVITYEAIAFTPVYTTTPVNLGESRSRGTELIAGDRAVPRRSSRRELHVHGVGHNPERRRSDPRAARPIRTRRGTLSTRCSRIIHSTARRSLCAAGISARASPTHRTRES